MSSAAWSAWNFPKRVADVVISNCVINLCPDKEAAYREAFRILKTRRASSDFRHRLCGKDQSRGPRALPHPLGRDASAARSKRIGIFKIVRDAGFTETEIAARHQLQTTELEEMACCPGREFTPAPAKKDVASVEGKVVSVKFRARKPARD